MEQLQINKKAQRAQQLMDQNNSNKLLVLLLSTAENLAAKTNKNIKRVYYKHDFGHSFESKDKNRLLLQLIEQIELFFSSYKRYFKDYQCYDFPYDENKKNGLSKNEIIKDLNYWKNNVKKEYKKYYQAIIDIFNGKEIPNFDEDVENISNLNDDGRKDSCNPRYIRDIYPILLGQTNEEKKEIMNEFENDPNYSIIINKIENNKNSHYEKKINKALLKNEEYKKNSVFVKNNIKFSLIEDLDKKFKDFTSFIHTKLLQNFNLNNELLKNLDYYLMLYKKNNLHDILLTFCENFNFNQQDTELIISYLVDEIEKELNKKY